VFGVADLTDGGAALRMHETDFAGTQLQLGGAILDGNEFNGDAGGPRHLGALAGKHFDAMHAGGGRNDGEREAVARAKIVGVSLERAVDGVADLQALGGENVGLLTVGVGEEREERATVRIVFDRLDAGANIELGALEIDDAVKLLMATATAARRETAVDIAATGLVLVLDQRALGALVGDLGRPVQRGETKRGRKGAEGFESHGGVSLDELDLVALLEGDDGALRIGGVVWEPAAGALRLALDILDVHARDRDLEGLLDGFANGVLRGRGIDLERVLAVVRGKLGGFLRQAHVFENFVGADHDWPPLVRAMICSSALVETTIFV
jgi:hypothetical protein